MLRYYVQVSNTVTATASRIFLLSGLAERTLSRLHRIFLILLNECFLKTRPSSHVSCADELTVPPPSNQNIITQRNRLCIAHDRKTKMGQCILQV